MWVTVEVSVNLQVPASLDLVKPAANEVRIGDETLYPGEAFEKVKDGCRVQLCEYVPRRLP